jgi:hypothetical protein
MKAFFDLLFVLCLAFGAWLLVEFDHPYWACVVSMLFGSFVQSRAKPEQLAKNRRRLQNPCSKPFE